MLVLLAIAFAAPDTTEPSSDPLTELIGTLESEVRQVLTLPRRKRWKRWSRLDAGEPRVASSWPRDAMLLEICSELGVRGAEIRSDLGADLRTVTHVDHLAELSRIARTREVVCGSVRFEAVDFYEPVELALVQGEEPRFEGDGFAVYDVGSDHLVVADAHVVRITLKGGYQTVFDNVRSWRR